MDSRKSQKIALVEGMTSFLTSELPSDAITGGKKHDHHKPPNQGDPIPSSPMPKLPLILNPLLSPSAPSTTSPPPPQLPFNRRVSPLLSSPVVLHKPRMHQPHHHHPLLLQIDRPCSFPTLIESGLWMRAVGV